MTRHCLTRQQARQITTRWKREGKHRRGVGQGGAGKGRGGHRSHKRVSCCVGGGRFDTALPHSTAGTTNHNQVEATAARVRHRCKLAHPHQVQGPINPIRHTLRWCPARLPPASFLRGPCPWSGLWSRFPSLRWRQPRHLHHSRTLEWLQQWRRQPRARKTTDTCTAHDATEKHSGDALRCARQQRSGRHQGRTPTVGVNCHDAAADLGLPFTISSALRVRQLLNLLHFFHAHLVATVLVLQNPQRHVTHPVRRQLGVEHGKLRGAAVGLGAQRARSWSRPRPHARQPEAESPAVQPRHRAIATRAHTGSAPCTARTVSRARGARL